MAELQQLVFRRRNWRYPRWQTRGLGQVLAYKAGEKPAEPANAFAWDGRYERAFPGHDQGLSGIAQGRQGPTCGVSYRPDGRPWAGRRYQDEGSLCNL